jgi:hypothetical protein
VADAASQKLIVAGELAGCKSRMSCITRNRSIGMESEDIGTGPEPRAGLGARRLRVLRCLGGLGPKEPHSPRARICAGARVLADAVVECGRSSTCAEVAPSVTRYGDCVASNSAPTRARQLEISLTSAPTTRDSSSNPMSHKRGSPLPHWHGQRSGGAIRL